VGKACYLSVQNLLSSSARSKNFKIKIHTTIILPVVFHGSDTFFLLQREHGLRMLENRVLSGIFGPRKEEEVAGRWRRLHY
jgi:hypothetical protein